MKSINYLNLVSKAKMKTTLILVVIFISASNLFGQRKIHGLIDFNRTEINDRTLKGMNIGIELKSKWQLKVGMQYGDSRPDNLPALYKGPEIRATTEIIKLELGHRLNLFKSDKVWLNIGIGTHRAQYTDFINFEFVPPPEEPDYIYGGGIAGFIFNQLDRSSYQNALDNYVSHTYQIRKERQSGINGQLSIETLVKDKILLGIGTNFMSNKRESDGSVLIKAGLRI
jgi:hypothetical protein